MKKIFNYILIILFLLITGLVIYAYNSPWRLDTDEARQRLSKKEFDLILDVRTQAERAALGSYPGSVTIPSSELEVQMPSSYPDKSIRILAYCNTGQRSRKAVEILHRLGYTNSYYIATPYTTII